MSVNTMSFKQISSVLTSIVKQATGRSVETPTDTGSFVSVGQIALNADRDKVFNAITELIGKTMFSYRPYNAVLEGLYMDTFRWGNIMRKLSICDEDWQDDPAFAYPVFYDANQTPPTGNGQSVDMWKIKKPNVLQTNFYGQSVYFDELTIFERQLETAFRSPDELGQFLTMVLTKLNNRIELSNEGIKRGLCCNMIGSLVKENDTTRVVKLLTMYNSQTGLSLTKEDIYKPDNFPAFVKWAYAVIEDYSDMFKQESLEFQTTIAGKPVLRNTPKDKQKVYLSSRFLREITSRVKADTFHDTFLTMADVEAITFWQSITDRDSISVHPAYTDTSGTVVYDNTADSEVEVNDILGIMFDEDMMGMTVLDRRLLSTPKNTRGEYRNLHFHASQRCVFDNTEKGVVFLLQ